MDPKVLAKVDDILNDIRDFKLAMRSRIPKDASVRGKIASITYLSQMTSIFPGYASNLKMKALRGIVPDINVSVETMQKDWDEMKKQLREFFDKHYPLETVES